MKEDNAAIFAGAGLSRTQGFVNWKELLRELAEYIGLDVDKESDLAEIAQFYVNSKRQNRHSLNQKLLEEFTKDAVTSENLRILASLPIFNYWTTNYDKLLEKALEEQNRKPDVKTAQQDLAQNVPQRDAIVYKMHGDINRPEETVLIKDDYEAYNEHRKLFTTNLQGDLISKTFLFIGFSFEDPNLNFILSSIRLLLGENSRDHYCFFRRLQEKDFDYKEDYIYEKTKQDLKIEDLQRYSINAVLVDEYEEITGILKDIERKYKLNNILISGSAATYEPFDEKEGQSFIHELSKSIVDEGWKTINGFGLGVGDFVINGALQSIKDSKYKKVTDYLELKPFPQFGDNLKEQWSSYREDIISSSGIAIFVFGNKNKNGEIVEADGVLEEFEIAKKQNKYIIPVGITGHASKTIYEEIRNDSTNYDYLQGHLETLAEEKEPEKLIKHIIMLIKSIQKY
ncbi:SIR2 family protein [Salimicrobium album]|uniref:SIR2 family protein n=1 Tax=Salimicrobium album TaxID=50717 RepID=UPI001FE1EB2E|nr:SIR2 family protein [Salimicrobium album]